MKKGMNINDSVHGLVRLTAYEKKILCSPEFNRLHDVYQNSTVFMTFPANRTKRFEIRKCCFGKLLLKTSR